MADSLENVLSILVELEFADDNLARVNANLDRLAVRLLTRHSLDVNEVFQTVDRGDLAFSALVGATNDGDFVVLPDGHASNLSLVRYLLKLSDEGTYTVLLSELLGERSAHDRATLMRRRTEVCLARLAPRRSET